MSLDMLVTPQRRLRRLINRPVRTAECTRCRRRAWAAKLPALLHAVASRRRDNHCGPAGRRIFLLSKPPTLRESTEGDAHCPC
jgi:hypothetical protein